jgi:hypothetical protein
MSAQSAAIRQKSGKELPIKALQDVIGAKGR